LAAVVAALFFGRLHCIGSRAEFSARAEGRVAESLAKFSAAALTAVESDAVKAVSDSSTVAPSRESFFAYLCPDGFDIMSGRF
jgi:hypothetical protein